MKSSKSDFSSGKGCLGVVIVVRMIRTDRNNLWERSCIKFWQVKIRVKGFGHQIVSRKVTTASYLFVSSEYRHYVSELKYKKEKKQERVEIR